MEFSEATLADRLVLGAIAHRVSNDNGEAFPSVETIAREARVSERTVQYSIESLKAIGELEVDLQSSPLGTNTYRLPKFHAWVQTLHPGGVQNVRRGVQKRRQGVQAIAPEPSLEPSSEPSVSAGICPECGFEKKMCMGHKKPKVKTWPNRPRFEKESRHVQEIPTRSKGEERAERTRKALEILDHPEKYPEHLRPTIPARGQR